MTGIPGDGQRSRALRLASVRRMPLVRWLVLGVLTAIVVSSFWDAFLASWSRLQHDPIRFSWHLPAATLLFALAVPVSGILWGKILTQLDGKAIGHRDAASAHLISWLLKYIPGQVGSFTYKVFWGKARGHLSQNVALSFLYENLFQQLASLLPSVIILSIAMGGWGTGFQSLLLGSAALGSVAAMIVLLGPGMPLLVRQLGKRWPGNEPGRIGRLSVAGSMRLAILFMIPRFMNGVAFVLIAMNMAPLTALEWLPLSAIYVLAGAIGILAVFVPSGIGVREGLIVAFAQDYVGTADAIILAALARLLSIIADVLILSIYSALRLSAAWGTK